MVHSWKPPGYSEAIRDNRYSMYYRGEKIKRAVFRGQTVWEQEGRKLLDGFIVHISSPSNRSCPIAIVEYGRRGSTGYVTPWRNSVEMLDDPYTHTGNFINSETYVPKGYNGYLNYTIPQNLANDYAYRRFYIGSTRGITGDRLYVDEIVSPLPAPPTAEYPESGSRVAEGFSTPYYYNSEYHLTYLKKIPENLFQAISSNATSAKNCLSYCGYLESIPKNLFKGFKNATSFQSAFFYCEKILEIPEGLFDDCLSMNDVRSLFQSCKNLQYIPNGLFKNCKSIKVADGLFAWSSIETIPEDLFETFDKTSSFNSAFKYCAKLKNVPEGLFDTCVSATEFYGCFNNCYDLEYVPENIFDNCTMIRELEDCFRGCVSLRHVPELWKKFPNSSHKWCFSGCTNADNYDDIPGTWKGYHA